MARAHELLARPDAREPTAGECRRPRWAEADVGSRAFARLEVVDWVLASR